MRKKEKCCVCKKPILDIDKCYKIKEKILYEDNGIWYNFKTSYVCEKCMEPIRKLVKAQV